MTTLLLILIYIAFIGLGVPDSLIGAAWPAIYTEFRLPISFASFITIITCCGTVASSMLSSRVIRRFGTGRVAAVSTAMTALALLGFSFSRHFAWMCLCAVPLGLGAGSIDTALNNYVALHYSATHMSFLHCFYGVGVSVSPYILSLVISGARGWRGGYRIAFFIQTAIAALLFLALPLWKRAHGGESGGVEEANTKVLSLREIARIPGTKLMWLMFIASCAVECTAGGWGATWLVEYKRMSVEGAARMVMFYYIGMALGRFFSGVLAARLHSWRIIALGQIVLGVAVVILLLPLSPAVAAAGLFLVGLGNGPMFPNFNYLTPENFGEENSQSIIGVQMAFSYMGIMLAPALCGLLGQTFGMGVFPPYIAVFYLVMVAATWRIRRVLGASRK